MAGGVTRPTGSLKAFLEANKKPTTRLLGEVERHLMLAPPQDRRTDILHPSEIVKHDWCHRASWFALSGVKPKKTNPTLRLQNIFDEGHYIHAKWQNRFRDMGNLYGKWSCKNCGWAWYDKSPLVCEECQSPAIDYAEVTLISDPEFQIIGHTDGWVTGINDDTLIEIKSMSIGTVRMESPVLFNDSGGNLDTAWGLVKRPFSTHIRQGALYLALGQQMVRRGVYDSFPDEIVFIYERKDNQQIKEFSVFRDDPTVEPILEAAARIVTRIGQDRPLRCNLDPGSGCQKCRAYEEAAE